MSENYSSCIQGKLILNAPGGDVCELEKFKDALESMRRCGMSFEVVIDGIVGGSAVYLAFSTNGDKPKMTIDSGIKLMSSGYFYTDDTPCEEVALKKKELEAFDGRMAQFLSECGNGVEDKEFFLGLMKRKTWLSAKEAEGLGLVTLVQRYDG